MVLTTISAALFLVVFLADLFGLHTNPYIGIVFFLLLPAAFLVGLVLIPLGAWLERRRRAAGKPPTAAHWPRIDLNDPAQRRTAIFIFLLTIANVVIVSLAAYRGVEYMDSVAFCGQVCHTAMKPEFIGHQTGSHASVKCIDCHGVPGALGFVSAKASGTRRLVAAVRGNYAKPIVPAARQLPTARETCERCHSPQVVHGDRLRTVVEYGDGEKNAASTTRLTMHVGTIHRHNAKNIEYVAVDTPRQSIPYVRMTSSDGQVQEFVTPGWDASRATGAGRRRMDCTDCHNRPSHVVAPTPERAVDEAIARGAIPLALPFIHREAVKALKAGNSASLRDFYRTEQPEAYASHGSEIDRAIAAVQDIHDRNVFPDMTVTFGTYPNNIGHIDAPGCFRCHDGEHKTEGGAKIGQDCETCHAID
jgi:hypothetical protein